MRPQFTMEKEQKPKNRDSTIFCCLGHQRLHNLTEHHRGLEAKIRDIVQLDRNCLNNEQG